MNKDGSTAWTTKQFRFENGLPQVCRFTCPRRGGAPLFSRTSQRNPSIFSLTNKVHYLISWYKFRITKKTNLENDYRFWKIMIGFIKLWSLWNFSKEIYSVKYCKKRSFEPLNCWHFCEIEIFKSVFISTSKILTYEKFNLFLM